MTLKTSPDFTAKSSPISARNLRILLLLLAGYFGWQMILRLLISNSAGLDEGEQLLLTQKLAWGYGPQPPLYTWLQYPFIRLFGPSIFALSLFKNLLLFGLYLFTFFAARRVAGAVLPATAAAVSLLFVPQIAWESQRDLTQSVLATLMSMATFYVFLRLSESRRLFWYALFGLCAAMGMLAKYNYLVFFAGLIAAAVSLKSLRAIILNWKMLAALALIVALTSPHWLWVKNHPDVAFATSQKLHIESGHASLSAFLTGITDLVGSIGTHVGALLGVCLLVCRKRLTPPAASTANPLHVQLLERSFIFILALLILAIACLHVTNVKDRWFSPVLICLPVYLAAKLTPRLNLARLRVLIGMGLAVMLAVSILLPGRIWFAGRWCKPSQLNAPFDRMASQIRPSISADTILIADSSWVGGNLRLSFPNHFIASERWLPGHFWQDGDDCLLAWDATRTNSPPKLLTDFAAANVNLESNGWHFIEAPLKFCSTNQMRLGLMRGHLKDSPKGTSKP